MIREGVSPKMMRILVVSVLLAACAAAQGRPATPALSPTRPGAPPPEPEPAGFQFYKLIGRDTLSLQQAKAEIGAAIRKSEIESANKAVMDPIHTDLNETYFGPRSTGAPLPVRPPRGPQPHPPAAPSGSSTTKPVEPLSSNQ